MSNSTVKDRAKIRAALSIVALSVTMGIDQSMFKGTNSVVVEPAAIIHEEKRKNKVQIQAVGKVKKSSIEKVQKLLHSYLDDTSFVDKCVVIEGESIESFTRGKLKIPNYKLSEGQQVSSNKDVNIYVAEDTIDTNIPSIAMSINQYFREKGGVRV